MYAIRSYYGLGDDAEDAPGADEDRAVVQPPPLDDGGADDRRRAAGCGGRGNLPQGEPRLLEEQRLEEKVAAGIAGDCEFGEDEKSAAALGSLGDRLAA